MFVLQSAAALITLSLATCVFATYGGDISEPYDNETFQCCVDNGWSFVIVRSYLNYGTPDTNAPYSLQQAQAGGITYTDIYHFPCAGISAYQQVDDDYNGVGGAGAFGMMWFDIETNPDPNCAWSSDLSSNCNFLGQLISAGQALNIHMGLYSSAYMWSTIMGDDCTIAADNGLPLWYAHYDGNPSFSDFSPFGGWSTPAIKQYWDSVGYCGISADADWY